jgi:hypothetical protein
MIGSYAELMDDACHEGWVAASHGLPRTANPYAEGNLNYAWAIGWEDHARLEDDPINRTD